MYSMCNAPSRNVIVTIVLLLANSRVDLSSPRGMLAFQLLHVHVHSVHSYTVIDHMRWQPLVIYMCNYNAHFLYAHPLLHVCNVLSGQFFH